MVHAQRIENLQRRRPHCAVLPDAQYPPPPNSTLRILGHHGSLCTHMGATIRGTLREAIQLHEVHTCSTTDITGIRIVLDTAASHPDTGRRRCHIGRKHERLADVYRQHYADTSKQWGQSLLCKGDSELVCCAAAKEEERHDTHNRYTSHKETQNNVNDIFFFRHV